MPYKCALIRMSGLNLPPDPNKTYLKQLLKGNDRAYILCNDQLYYINPDAPNNKVIINAQKDNIDQINQLFPTKDNSTQDASIEQLHKMTLLTGHIPYNYLQENSYLEPVKALKHYTFTLTPLSSTLAIFA